MTGMTSTTVTRLAAMLTILFACSVAAAQSAPAEPAPARAAAAASDADVYRVGAGDSLLVVIHPGGETSPTELDITVAGDGTIDVVHAGRMKVLGLTTSEIREQIRKKLIASAVFLQPQVSVNVKEYKSQGVNVAGAVTKQGRYYLQGTTRLLDIISEAEGIDDEKAGSFIMITREGEEAPLRVSRRDLLGSDVDKARAANIKILAGDNVNVPIKSRFCVSGAVNQPGCFPLEEGTNLHQAISLGGGLDLKTVDRKNILIRRADGSGEVHVDLETLEASNGSVPLVAADDVVIVGSHETTRFCVLGPVEKPDCYEYEKGLTLDGAISKAQGFDEVKANRKDIKIRRISSGKLQEFQVSFEDPSDAGQRFRIEPDDQIVVAKADCLITVGGSVKSPNQYPLTTGMSVVDAIQVAGGAEGPSGFGKLSNVTLIRNGQPQIINVKAIMAGKQPDVPVQCGDKIFLKARSF
jgi:polysaccharide export outer membrane protein